MAFCKVCVCGKKIVFQKQMSYPENCPSCGRRTFEYWTYPEDDPRVEELLRQYRKNSDENETDRSQSNLEQSNLGTANSIIPHYALKLENGVTINIPDEGGIVGRVEIGAEELANYPSVSRRHLKIIPRRFSGVIVEDLSTYGTLVDGKRIQKNTSVRVLPNSIITLCNVDVKLVSKEG